MMGERLQKHMCQGGWSTHTRECVGQVDRRVKQHYWDDILHGQEPGSGRGVLQTRECAKREVHGLWDHT